MARQTVTVKDVTKFSTNANGDIVMTSTAIDIIVDDLFMIDGVPMPPPDKVEVTDEVMMKDAERLPGNGEFIGQYGGIANNIKWTYKELNAAQYKYIYDNYVEPVVKNQDVFHKIKTLNIKLGKIMERTIYIQASIDDKVNHLETDGYMRFWDVVLEMTDKAGER